MNYRSNTKWFKYERALLVQRELLKKGITSQLIKTTKINKLSGEKKPAYLVKKVELISEYECRNCGDTFNINEGRNENFCSEVCLDAYRDEYEDNEKDGWSQGRI